MTEYFYYIQYNDKKILIDSSPYTRGTPNIILMKIYNISITTRVHVICATQARVCPRGLALKPLFFIYYFINFFHYFKSFKIENKSN